MLLIKRFFWELTAIMLISTSVTAGLAMSSNVSSPKSIKISMPINIENTAEKTLSYEEELGYFTSQLMDAYNLSHTKAAKYAEWMLASSLYNSVPEYILAGVIMTESSFRSNAVSSVGALGPAQIRPSIWAKTCSGNLSDPANNINCAGYVLRHYYEKYCSKNWQCALKHYNVGPGNLRKSEKYRQAGKRYVEKVSSHIAWLDNKYSLAN